MSVDRADSRPVRILARLASVVSAPRGAGSQHASAENFSSLYNDVANKDGPCADIDASVQDIMQSEGDARAHRQGPQPDPAQTPDLPLESDPSPRFPLMEKRATDLIAKPSGRIHARDAVTLSSRIVRACIRDEEIILKTEYLAAAVARFCNSPSIGDDGFWELQIEINPDIMRETQLHLQLSSYRLLLRFETVDHDSKRLIYENHTDLSARLHSLLQRKIDVDIICW